MPPSPTPDPETPQEARNFVVLAAFQIVTRLGWIFKTESVVIPVVLDLLSGSAWLRGCLPLLSRLGLSVPPLLLAHQVSAAPLKKRGLFLATAGMALTILMLAVLWVRPGSAGAASGMDRLGNWAAIGFLALYALFFACTGLHQVIYQTLQGKLVQATRRGRLLSVSNLFGSGAAILAVWWLLPDWLGARPPRVDWIFGFAGACLVGAAALSLMLVEPADGLHGPSGGWRQMLADSRRALRGNPNFARLCMAAALSGFSIVLFPHYQALGRARLQLQAQDLVMWIVVQNLGTAGFSLLVGPLADWRGNRLVLRLALMIIAALPVTALALTHLGEFGRSCYFVVFVLLGLLPVIVRLLGHYTLEISEPSDHPRFLSTLNMFQAAPALLAPWVGAAMDWTSLEAVFWAVALLNGIGWLMAWRLDEPRNGESGPPVFDDHAELPVDGF